MKQQMNKRRREDDSRSEMATAEEDFGQDVFLVGVSSRLGMGLTGAGEDGHKGAEGGRG